MAHGPKLYCLGGLLADDDEATSQVTVSSTMETLEIGTDSEWRVMPSSMTVPRMHPGAVAFSEGLQHFILVAGGRDSSSAHRHELDSCELYSVENDVWKPCQPMRIPRFACGLVYVPSIHSVIVVGGFDGQKNRNEWTRTCEMYDIETNEWIDLPPMRKSIQFVSATLLSGSSQGEDFVMVCGRPCSVEDADGVDYEDDDGTAYSVSSSILQCYNVLTEEWIVIPVANGLNSGAAMTSIDQNRIIIVGGSAPPTGASEATASGACRFWVPNFRKLWGNGEDYAAAALPPPPPPTATSTTAGSSVDVTAGDQSETAASFLYDDESTVHPWLYHHQSPLDPSGNSSVAARSLFSATTDSSAASANDKRRRKVENKSLLDNSGVQVQFTGFLSTETGKPHGKGQMTWPLTGDKYEGRFEDGGKRSRLVIQLLASMYDFSILTKSKTQFPNLCSSKWTRTHDVPQWRQFCWFIPR